MTSTIHLYILNIIEKFKFVSGENVLAGTEAL